MRKAISCLLLALLTACGAGVADDSADVDQLAVVAGPLSGTPDPVMFPNANAGDVCPGGGCTYAMVTIRNSGSTSQLITSASAPNPFWVTWGGTCNNTTNRKRVAAHASCTLEFGFRPTSGNGASSATGTITFASGLVLPVKLRGTGVSGLTATPDPLVFPNAVVGGTTCGSPGGTACTYGTITIANNLGTAQTISSAQGDGPFWVTWGGTCNSTTNNKTIASHGSCTLEFGFGPTAAATTNGTGTITFASGLVLPVKLRGTGVSGLTATPDPLVFSNAVVGGTACGSPGGTACTYGTITIANNLGTAQTISSAQVDSPFWVTWGGTCNSTTNNKTIASHGSCTLEFGFGPTAATTTNGTGTITFASGLVLPVKLRGTGVSGLTATPDPLVFPNAVVGGTTCGSPGGTACTYGTITIANNLGTAQTISSAQGDGPFWVTWGGTCNSTTNNKTIASHGSCTLEFGFGPTAAGTTSTGTGTVSFLSGLTLTIGLKGTSN